MKNRMKQFRQENGISQEQMAKMLGVSRQTIISIEKGRYNPSLPLAIQIARCFNTIVEKVFLLEDVEKE
ncbi:helix-turn-helix transcriptional regulator [Metabacillus sediminilitoris]|uniref:Helix-turn-helix transcriptional regulator n=1 Tax=Metabacillus sediminilitoris TaxID=2567941 RepID=A0A4S4BJY4_9BACI|nr:helix-turn-helix transcriptional regulator [Metabacillus sediminilitoris]QGQ48296.1 helix-turn-helix domain-containing protein [Metabacillus sediminilitoris]THF74037.1 helix-turn-helix transcriptional regulator [Metabacillus sediminilitoris]